WALGTRRVGGLVVYALSFLLAGTPIILQLSDFLQMTTHQARSVYEWDYLVGTFTTILLLPFKWEYYTTGGQGAFLRWPLGPLYLVGVVLAGLAVVPRVRRALRAPPVAAVLFGLLLWDTVLMTLTNNGYGVPSTKRVFSLIPIQVFLSLLPMMLVA